MIERRFDAGPPEGRRTHEDESAVPTLRDEDEELYGRLLLANERIDDVGTIFVWLVAVLTVGLCVALHMRWVDSLFGVEVDQLRGIGVYVLIALVGFLVFTVYTETRERRIYLSVRPELIRYFERHDISVYALLTRIHGDKALGEVAQKLRADRVIQELADSEGPGR